MKDYIFVAIILIMFVALSIIIPLCLIDKKSKHQEKINKKKERKKRYTYTWTGCENQELDKDLQHMMDELKRLSSSIGRNYQDASMIYGKNNTSSGQYNTIIGDSSKKSTDKISFVDKISTLNSLTDDFELYEGQVVYVKEDESSYMWNGKMWNRILFLGDDNE